MEIKRGIAVSPGVAIGPALVLDTEWFRIPQRYVTAEQIPVECTRTRQAFDEAIRDAKVQQETVSTKLGPEYGAIFGAHALLLTDPALIREIESLVREQHFA